MTMSINVLNCGDLFFQLFNVLAAFMNSSGFLKLVELSASFGFMMAITRCFKSSLNYQGILKWLVMYLLIFNVVLIPKTTVSIYDVSSQKTYVVANVPMAFAFVGESLTNLGFGLAQIFDNLFSILPNSAIPDSIQYTKTGFLFGSRIIQESRNFKVTNPELKADLSMYFKRCVVGDVYLNRTLSPTELKESNNIWESISKSPSKIRRTLVTNDKGVGENKTCFDATPVLKARLDKEITRSYTFFGINLFGKPKGSSYENLFTTHLNSAFGYYQALETTGSNAFLQAVMMNMVKEGVNDYQSYLNSTGSIMSHEFNKSQAQQRYQWELGGLKASWFFPFFHSVILFLVMALFPLIVLFAIAYNGMDAFKSYFIFFLSLQFWPVLFAILNFVMAFYGSSISSNYGAITLANFDGVEQLHSEVAGVAGYMMVFIPWLAYGLVTRIGETFNSLSHSMISGLQSSTMSSASEAAGASFSLGQSSFYNATGNTLSANKHDSNYTDMAGNTTRMLESGATLTTTADGGEMIDASANVSRGAISLVGNKAVSGMLSQAAETNAQSISSQSKQLGSVLSQGSNHLTQLSDVLGNDKRLGEGVSDSDSAQVHQSVANVLGIASTVAEKTGVSKEQALTGLINAGVSTQVGMNSNRSLAGKVLGFTMGVDGNVYARSGYDKSDSTAHRSHDGADKVLDAKQMQDFKHDLSYVENFSKTHHLDTSQSKGASLLSQVSEDLREASHISNNLDASYSRGERISNAQSVTETGGSSINANLDQLFMNYVTDNVGHDERNYLYGHPGDSAAHAKLSGLANQFVNDSGIREQIIDTYGNQSHSINPEARFKADEQSIANHESELRQHYSRKRDDVQQEADAKGVRFDQSEASILQNKAGSQINNQKGVVSEAKKELQFKTIVQSIDVDKKISHGRTKSHMSSVIKGEKE